MSGPPRDRDYDIHSLVRLRTNIPFTTLPAYFRSEAASPNLEIRRVPRIDLPPRDRIAAEVGYTVYDLGGGELVYDTDIPIMYLLGSRERWRFRVAGLPDEMTRVTTAVPFFDFRPVGFKVTELLSRLCHLILVIKLLDHGLAMCHATTVAKDGRAFLLFGYSGTGKSSLASRMIEAGYQYMSEDFTLVDREGRVYCYPDMPPSRSRLPRIPLMRYVRASFLDRPAVGEICNRAQVDSILILEKGSDRAASLDADDTLRKLMLLNLEEMSKLWNSPISVLLNHYAYFYPKLDLAAVARNYASTVASFVDHAERRELVRSSSPRFDALQDRLLRSSTGDGG